MKSERMGFTQQLSRRITSPFTKRDLQASGAEVPPLNRNDSRSSRLSFLSHHSGSSTSVSSTGSRKRFLKRKSQNWFFSEEFSHSHHMSEASRSPTTLQHINTIGADGVSLPVCSSDVIVLPMWSISVKGFVKEKLGAAEVEFLKLPETAQKSINRLCAGVTLFDYEHNDGVIRTIDSAVRHVSHASSSPRKKESKSVGSQRMGAQRNTAVTQKQRPKLVKEKSKFLDRVSSRKITTSLLDIENSTLQDCGLQAVLCKHESHKIGGSSVLTYFIRVQKLEEKKPNKKSIRLNRSFSSRIVSKITHS